MGRFRASDSIGWVYHFFPFLLSLLYIYRTTAHPPGGPGSRRCVLPGPYPSPLLCGKRRSAPRPRPRIGWRCVLPPLSINLAMYRTLPGSPTTTHPPRRRLVIGWRRRYSEKKQPTRSRQTDAPKSTAWIFAWGHL